MVEIFVRSKSYELNWDLYSRMVF